MQNKKSSKGMLIIFLMIGIFMTLVGVMGFIKSAEITDVIYMVAGLALAGVGLYKLVSK